VASQNATEAGVFLEAHRHSLSRSPQDSHCKPSPEEGDGHLAGSSSSTSIRSCIFKKNVEKVLVSLDIFCYGDFMHVGLHSNNISGWIDRRGLDGNRGAPRI
jgi:hypothetical protein